MSSDCAEARRHLYAYLDAELDSAAAAQVRAHLDDCPPCLHSFDFERRLKVTIRQSLSEEMPESLVDKVRDLIRQETA
jgi:mycothiol system anti-sigma-R factor